MEKLFLQRITQITEQANDEEELLHKTRAMSQKFQTQCCAIELYISTQIQIWLLYYYS